MSSRAWVIGLGLAIVAWFVLGMVLYVLVTR